VLGRRKSEQRAPSVVAWSSPGLPPTTATTVTPSNVEAARSRLKRHVGSSDLGYPGSADLTGRGVLVLLANQSAILGIACLVLAAGDVWNTRNWLRRVDLLLAKLT
jgi:hypothetical protein